MSVSQAFVTPAGAHIISSRTQTPSLPGRRHRSNRSPFNVPVTKQRQTPLLSIANDKQHDRQVLPDEPSPSSSRKPLSWPKVVLLTAGTALSTTFGIMNPVPCRASDERPMPSPQLSTTLNSEVKQNSSRAGNVWSPIRVASASTTSSESKPTTNHVAPSSTVASAKHINRKSSSVACNSISLDALGIKREDFLSDKELRRRKTTQFSEAEQEIMELDEWEIDTQWFRDMQTMWAALASIGGIYVLYKGGVMWENWIKEQEKKDMEEEIKLTGKFVDPRAVRKDEDDDPKKKNTKTPKKPSDSGGQGPSLDDQGGDFKQGDIESLEKLFGKS